MLFSNFVPARPAGELEMAAAAGAATALLLALWVGGLTARARRAMGAWAPGWAGSPPPSPPASEAHF